MRHARSLGFEALEGRQLLTAAHHAGTHAAAAPVPLVLNGTLAVDNKATSTTMNSSGGTTTSTPIAGALGSLGEVRGNWNESTDSLGNLMGPDTLQLHDAQGAFVVSFNKANLGKAHRIAHEGVYYELPQRVRFGTGAYARATENGSIELTTNMARTSVVSLTLTS